jgi:hypothetical protein
MVSFLLFGLVEFAVDQATILNVFPSPDQRYQEHHQEHREQDLRDARRRPGNARKTEQRCQQRDD